MNARFLGTVAVAMVIAMVGANLAQAAEQTAKVQIVNKTDETIYVYVDGNYVTTVGARATVDIYVTIGQRTLRGVAFDGRATEAKGWIGADGATWTIFYVNGK